MKASIGVRDPVRARHAGDRRAFGRAVGPVPHLFDRRFARLPVVGPWRALVDPGPEQRDLGVGQRIVVERHAVFAVEPEHAAHDEAVVALVRDDGGAGVAALEAPTPSGRAAAARATSSGRGTRRSWPRGSAGCRARSRPTRPATRPRAAGGCSADTCSPTQSRSTAKDVSARQHYADSRGLRGHDLSADFAGYADSCRSSSGDRRRLAQRTGAMRVARPQLDRIASSASSADRSVDSEGCVTANVIC